MESTARRSLPVEKADQNFTKVSNTHQTWEGYGVAHREEEEAEQGVSRHSGGTASCDAGISAARGRTLARDVDIPVDARGLRGIRMFTSPHPPS